MASISNRSAFTVTVPGYRGKDKNKYTRKFAYGRHKDAEAYMRALIEQGLTPDITQGETTFQVKDVRVGHEDKCKTFHCLKEAEAFVKRIESEAEVGLFRDYTQAAKTTTADLIRRYMEEDCPGMKGGDNYIIILRAMLEDSTHELRKRIAQRKAEIKEYGKALTPLGANRQPMTSLEWLHLPLNQVKPEHIEDFIADRVEYVEGATVDRQLDLLSSIYNRARKGWRIHMDLSPMDGVRRPKYFNERDRRLKGDEELRLLEAARKEDQMASLEAHVEALAADEVAAARQLGTHYAVNKARKEAYERAKRKAVEEGFPHVPRMEAFVQFQLATAARRGEALGLFWDRLNWEEKTAFIPTSKNGRPRKLSVRSDILALLQQLPRNSDLVFDIGVKELLAAWNRICDAARLEDLRVHDLRHEGISRAAESGKFPTVLDLQAFSGHRDIRSLSRYTHLCAGAITAKLEEAERERQEKLGNKGRMRLKQSDLHWLGGNTALHTTPIEALAESLGEPQLPAHTTPVPAKANNEGLEQVAVEAGNVITVSFRR
jgi:integrase